MKHFRREFLGNKFWWRTNVTGERSMGFQANVKTQGYGFSFGSKPKYIKMLLTNRLMFGIGNRSVLLINNQQLKQVNKKVNFISINDKFNVSDYLFYNILV